MKFKFITSYVCIALLAMACANEPLQDTDILQKEAKLTEANAKGIANAPAESGMYVIRTEDYVWAWVISDPKTELTAVVGWTYETQLIWCTEEYLNFDWALEHFDQVPSQIISNPNNEYRYIVLNQGDVNVTVYDGYYDYSYPNCNFFTTANVLAEGQTRFIQNDNDVLAFINNSNNVNAYSMRANGQLLSLNNEPMHLNVFWQFLWDKDPNSGFFDDLLKTSVQLH